MSSFGAQSHSPRSASPYNMSHNNNDQTRAERIEMNSRIQNGSKHGNFDSHQNFYQQKYYSGGKGVTNHGYHGSSMEDVSSVPRRSHANNGVTNRAYIPSTSSDDGLRPSSEYANMGNIPLPSITGELSYHDTNRYQTNDISDSKIKKKGVCQSRKCICITAVIVALILLIGAGVMIYLYLGTDLFTNGGVTQPTTVEPASSTLSVISPPATTVTSNVTVTTDPESSTESLTTSTKGLTTSNATSTTTSTTTAAMPDSDIFSGELRLNETWSLNLSDPASQAFQTKSQEFSNFMDSKMSSSLILGPSYNNTQVISLREGSIKVIFIITFNQPVVTEQVASEINRLADQDSTLKIIAGSVSITEYVEETACGLDSLILCNWVCRERTEVACNTINDCGDWYDETNCPGQSVSCDFETSETCGYEIQQTDYQWVYNSGNTSIPGTGPQHDHTYQNESGHYYYTEWCNKCQHGDVATIYSPWYVTRRPSCLSFYYHMMGHPTDMGALYLSAYDQNLTEKLLWTREKPDAEDNQGSWQRVEVDIPPGSYRFTFGSLFHGGSDLGDKAIDDILVEDGACESVPACNASLFCSITNECLSSADRPLCNGKFECPDGSDEDGCSDSVYSTTFESGMDLSTYSLKNMFDNPQYQWGVSKGPTSVKGTYHDNTYKNPLGHYVAILPGTLSEVPAGSESPLVIEQDLSSNQGRCLRFTYNMNYEGSASGTGSTLKVLARNVVTGNLKELWNNTELTGRDWMHASYSIMAEPQSYRIEFVAARLNGDGVVISLDDITIMNGLCKCDDPSRRQCPDRKCIPEEWFCDGDQDCDDGADENNCPTCPVDEYTCRDRSCVPGTEATVRCDGTYDCADGSDESLCAYVDQCSGEDCIKLSHSEGNYEVCATDWDASLNSQICRYLHKSPDGSSNSSTTASPSSSKFLRLTNPGSDGFLSKFSKVNSCPNNQVIMVNCEDATCGTRSPLLSPYIIGGSTTTEQGRWPWQVDLRLRGVHHCGATLLNHHWVLTAAHCIGQFAGAPNLFKLNFGSTKNYPGQPNSVELAVKRIFLHPDYANIFGGDDIALLFVDTPINYTNEIRPACLPALEDVYSSRSTCYITGWGRIATDRVYPEDLQEAKYKLTSWNSCRDMWSPTLSLRDSMQCAGYSSGTIRTCKGDSGGPLVCLDKYKRWSLVGITSLGPSGCFLETHKDDIFTKVSSYLPWVMENIGFQFNCTNGRKLVDRELLCDAVDDCGDNSDEVIPCTLSVECDFESRNLCGYTLGGDWRNVTGPASLTGSLHNTGPIYDHTVGIANNVATYLVTSVDGAVLTTPTHNSSDTSCLQFFYYLSHTSKIEVLAGDFSLAKVGTSANSWQYAQHDIISGTYQLKLKAEIPVASYVAIDDVTVSQGACTGSCPPGMFKCQTQCIPSAYVCDGIAQCLNAADEQGCTSRPDTIECTFDEAYACGIRHSDDSEFNMVVSYNNPASGPANGHEDDADETDISYLLAVAPQSHLKSTIVWPVAPAADSCLTLWYYMEGSSVGSLEVKSGGQKLWQEFGSQGAEWLRARVNVKSGNSVEISVQSGDKDTNFIAIDDLSLSAGGCPPTPSCDSQTEHTCPGKCINKDRECDKTVDCFDLSDELTCDWTVNCDFQTSCPSYSSSSFLPSYTWQINSADGYLTADPVSTDRGAKADYISAPFLLDTEHCLSFRYLLTGESTANPELRINLRQPIISKDTTIWRVSLNDTVWRTGRVTLTPTDQSVVSLVFQALYGGNKDVPLSIDDIHLSSGRCSLPVCADQFLCPYEEKCIPTSAQCDGIAHCQGGVDEEDCGDLAEALDCNFDDDFCQWTRSTTGLSLAREAGSTPLQDTGPLYDNTQNNLVGFYLYLKSKVSSGTATLTSPAVKISTGHCLTFYYHMIGRNIGYLNVSNAASPADDALLSIFGAHGSAEWHVAKIDVHPTDALQLRFTFTSNGLFSNTAIDDITFRPGSCDCSDDHQCPVSGECFDKMARCDNIPHCQDGSDEQNCGCGAGQTLCAAFDACLPTDFICSQANAACLVEGQVIDCKCNSTFQRSCDQGFCYDQLAYCNGHQDCDDGSDEPPLCATDCPSGFIACPDKSHCIPQAFWCDNNANCPDAADEQLGCVPQVPNGIVTDTDCSTTNFVCLNNSQVITREKYCDGTVDCEDASDEPAHCECCDGKEFSCTTGHMCIPLTSKCDGSYDCADFSDETSCNCTADEFQCDAGICLTGNKRCDGKLDCNDWSDETNCTCRSSQFQCDNSRCIDGVLKCNGRDDCLDNSDEFDCPCASTEVRCTLDTDRHCIPEEWKCDGFKDCEGTTDEAFCGNCSEFTCTDYSCLLSTQVCDSVSDCKDGEDELHCFQQEANLMVTAQVASETYSVCYDGWSAAWGSQLCRQLGYDHVISTRILPTEGLSGPWAKLNYSQGYQKLSELEIVPSCSNALAVECEAKGCGVGKGVRQAPYLIGGNLVSESTDWPWLMPIYYSSKLTGTGVHIGNGWIVTAGHLVQAQLVRDGVRFIERRENTPHLFEVEPTSLIRNQSGTRLSVTKVVVHPEFTHSPTLRNDVALMKVNMASNYPSICLSPDSVSHTPCYVAGWGSVDGQNIAVDQLRDTRVDVLPDLDCLRAWNSGGFTVFYASTMMCGGGVNLPSTCFGDSGGPLMCLNADTNTWNLRGVVSFGDTNCLRQEKPNVFTELTSYYSDWIEEITAG